LTNAAAAAAAAAARAGLTSLQQRAAGSMHEMALAAEIIVHSSSYFSSRSAA